MRENIDYGSGTMRPKWRGRLHALGALASGPTGVAVAAQVVTAPGRAAVMMLSWCMTLTYGVSAWYHLVVRTPRAQAVLKRLDHAAIFVLIAGSHTALAVVTLDGAVLGIAVAGCWAVAVLGMALKLSGFKTKLAEITYGVCGWGILSVAPWMWARAGGVMWWVLPCGIAYSVGAVAFAKRWPRERCETFGYHEVWHAVTLVGGMGYMAVIAHLGGV
jgi:hemolysin III